MSRKILPADRVHPSIEGGRVVGRQLAEAIQALDE